MPILLGCSTASRLFRSNDVECPAVVMLECPELRAVVVDEDLRNVLVDWKLAYRDCALQNKAKLQCLTPDH